MTAPPADDRELLAERARRLARPETEAERHRRGLEEASALMVVRIGDERVGISLDHITEVHRSARLTPVPGARPPVAGVIAWRGRVLTILDIAVSRRGPIAIGESTRIIVIGRRRAAFGIIADEVDDVQDVDMQDTALVEEVDPARREFVRGVTPDALVVLDAPALIARFAPTH